MTDQQMFYARILKTPDDDNIRLFYADWMSDNPFLACTCDDGAQDTGASTPWGEWISIKCPNCDGTGNLYHGFPERAAFIRAQVWLSQVKPKPCQHECKSEGPPGIYCTSCGHAPECCNCDLHEMVRWPLIQQQKAAFAAAEKHLTAEIDHWYRLIGDSKVAHTDYMAEEPRIRFKATFRRGFVDEIECTIGQWMGFGECSGCSGRGWNPDGGPIPEQEQCEICDGRGVQPAIGPLVVADQPVTRVKFADLRAADRVAVNQRWYWFRSQSRVDESSAHIPSGLFDHLEPARLNATVIGVPFESEGSANDAISTAAILWAQAQPSASAARTASASETFA